MTLEELEARKAEIKDYFWFCWNFKDPEGWTKSDFGLGVAHAAAALTNKFIRMAVETGAPVPDEEIAMGIFHATFAEVMYDLEILGEDEESQKVLTTLLTGQRPE